jgi:hypothetical protein
MSLLQGYRDLRRGYLLRQAVPEEMLMSDSSIEVRIFKSFSSRTFLSPATPSKSPIYRYHRSSSSSSTPTSQAKMKFSAIFSILAFGASFTSVYAQEVLCCSECPKRLQECIDTCVAEGHSETFCGRGSCTGVVMSCNIPLLKHWSRLSEYTDWMRLCLL